MTERDMWNYVDGLEARLRVVEATIAVHSAHLNQIQMRGNYLPAWLIASVGVAVSVISVLISLWAGGGP